MRYVLYYLHYKGEPWEDDYYSRWENMECKTLREAKEYLEIAGSKAYIVDTVTGNKIAEND